MKLVNALMAVTATVVASTSVSPVSASEKQQFGIKRLCENIIVMGGEKAGEYSVGINTEDGWVWHKGITNTVIIGPKNQIIFQPNNVPTTCLDADNRASVSGTNKILEAIN